MLEALPILIEWNMCEGDEHDDVSDVPELFKLGNLTNLKSLVLFSVRPSSFAIPEKYQEMFQLIRVAEYFGADHFMEAAAKWLEVDLCEITNNNNIRPVVQLIRGRYRAAKHNHPQPCAVCHQPFPSRGPCRVTPSVTPCCQLLVHSSCLPTDYTCTLCSTVLRVLPCVVCRQVIAPGEDIAMEYSDSLLHRTPCCGSDCHPQCKRDVTTCPLCNCPLNNWKIDEFALAGDIIFARRSQRMNAVRRRDGLTYDVIPLNW